MTLTPSDSDNRRPLPRFAVKLDAKIVFTASAKATSAMVKNIGAGLTLNCSTHNVSEHGVGLLVSARNIDRYLTSEQVKLEVEVKLPSGVVKFTATSIHHERLRVDNAAVGYFVGVEIARINPTDQTAWIAFVRGLAQRS